jgi:hypothetical protein
MASILPDTISLPVPPRISDRLLPVISGVALMIAGTALSIWRPGFLDLPKPVRSKSATSGFGRAVEVSRDGLMDIAPDNVTDTIGRSLAITGMALILIGAFDAVLDARDER